MLDAADIVALLTTYWSISPTIGSDATSNLFLSLDEHNPKNPRYQIILINKPAREHFMCPSVIMVEQEIVFELHVIPVRYDPDAITSFRQDFKNIKAEVTRILNLKRFDSVGNTINMAAWVDEKIPHGYSKEKEPLQMVSRLSLSIRYYEVDSA